MSTSGKGNIVGASERAGWPDVAKGMCIVLVVLWHVVTKHAIFVDGAGPITAGWGTLNYLFLPLRLPLFFLISGMFAGRALFAADGGHWRRRAGQLGLLYLLWVLVQTFALAATPDFPTARARDGWELIANLTFSPTNLWYLLALAFYLVVGRASRNAPAALVLSAAFIVSTIASAGVLPDWGNLWQVFQNLFFFLVGLRLKPLADRFVARAGLAQLVALGAGFIGATVLVTAFDIEQWPGIWVTVSAIAVAAGICGSVLIDRHLKVMARLMRWLGRRTLPIYVIHMVVLAAIDSLLGELVGGTSALWEAIGPVVLTTAVVAVSLAVHALLVRARLGVLFNPLSLADRWASVQEGKARRNQLSRNEGSMQYGPRRPGAQPDNADSDADDQGNGDEGDRSHDEGHSEKRQDEDPRAHR